MKIIEDKLTIGYYVEISTPSDNICSRVNPFGQCTPTDCMTCKYSKVKIIREDEIVMRDDTINNNQVNTGYIEKYNDLKYKWQNKQIEFLEEFFGLKLTYWQKKLLSILMKKN